MENNVLQKPSPLSRVRQAALFINYFVGYMYVYPIVLSKIALFIDPNARLISVYLQAIVYGGMIVSSIYLAWPLLKESYQTWKEKKPRVIRINAKIFLQLYVASFAVSILISMLAGAQTSANQLDVVDSVQRNPLLMIFVTMLFAPIVEETVFRGVFFRTIRSTHQFWIAGLISGLAFGLIHVSLSLFSGNLSDVWFLFSYALIGVFMSYSYEKTGTIFGPFLLHFFNNFLAFIVIVLQ